MQGEGIIEELVLLDGKPAARILCAPSLIPAPGRYLLAHANGSDSRPALYPSVLAASIFSTKSFPDTSASAGGFLCAPPIPESWTPGTRLNLRGPLGHGFDLPVAARRVTLIAFDDLPRRLLALLDSILRQDASVALICGNPPDDLPPEVEVQPMSALADICNWADYIAMDAARGSLPELKKMFGMGSPLGVRGEAQILIRTPMPCGGLAECGVCAVEGRKDPQLACEDGPVFDLNELT